MVLAEDLRQAVLQIAIQGKLVKQLETDRSVNDYLVQISKRKAKLIENKEIKKEPELSDCKNEELQFEIPDNWKWVKLGNLCSKIGAGSTPKGGAINYVAEGVPFIREQNVYSSGLVYNGMAYITEELNESKAGSMVRPNDLLLNITGGSIGRCALIPNDFITGNVNQHVLIIRLVDVNVVKYLHIVINSPYIQSQIREKAKGDKEGLSATSTKSFYIPFPPIEEQKRIVDKINEIMPKIDEYEKIEKELGTLKKEFPKDMKDAFLQAAMQGKLTEQLESDSSVDELLGAIKKEKEELIAQKKIKKEKPLPDISEEEIPFDIPENWRWVRLGNIGTLTRGNGIKRNEVTETGFPCIRYGELYTTYKTKFDVAVSHTSKELFNKSQKVKKNDILMALTGENNFDIALALAYVGDETVAMGGDLTRWSYHHMNPLYLVYAMNSSYAIHEKSEMAKGDIIVHISNDKLSTILLPIPPIEEQNRIVEKLDTLLPLCEDLKE